MVRFRPLLIFIAVMGLLAGGSVAPFSARGEGDGLACAIGRMRDQLLASTALQNALNAGKKVVRSGFRKELDHNLGTKDETYTLDSLNADLNALDLSPFQRWVLRKLWEKEASENYRFFDTRGLNTRREKKRQQWFRDNLRQIRKPEAPYTRLMVQSLVSAKQKFAAGLQSVKKNFVMVMPVPYPMELSRGVVKAAVASARAQGLKPADRYVVVPFKMLLTDGIKNPELLLKHGLMIFALTASGQLLDRMDFGAQDPLLNSTDPSKLKDDEVTLLVKLLSAKEKVNVSEREDVFQQVNEAENADGIMKELQKNHPNKFVYADLSSEGGEEFLYAEKLARILKEQVGETGKKVKHVVISSHGAPGVMRGDNQDFKTEDLGRILSAIRPYLAKDATVDFSACYFAGSAAAEAEITVMAQRNLPEGVTVRASRFAYLVPPPQYRWWNKTGPTFADRSLALKALTIMSPINEVGIWGILGLEQAARFKSYTLDQHELGLDPKTNFEKLTGGRFEYVVGSSKGGNMPVTDPLAIQRDPRPQPAPEPGPDLPKSNSRPPVVPRLEPHPVRRTLPPPPKD